MSERVMLVRLPYQGRFQGNLISESQYIFTHSYHPYILVIKRKDNAVDIAVIFKSRTLFLLRKYHIHHSIRMNVM